MNVKPATTHPQATQEIDGMISMIQTLVDKGYAYAVADGTVYFRVKKFKEYGKHIVENAQALAKGLVQRGFNLVSGGTDNHLMLVDLRPFSITGKELEHRLDEVYITVNKNAIPNDPEKPFVTSGIRVGTPAVTTRGLGVAEMDQIAECMYLTATQFDKADEIREMVTAICKQYPLYE